MPASSLFEEVGMAFVEQRLAENIRLLEDRLKTIPDVEFVTLWDPAKRCRNPDFSPSRRRAIGTACTTDETAAGLFAAGRGFVCRPISIRPGSR